MNNQHHRRQRGFSLIELMIVMSIIGILIAISYGAFQAAQRAANETAAISNMGKIAQAQVDYHRSRRQYGTFDELTRFGSLPENFAGDEPIVDGYRYKMEVIPKGNGQLPAYRVNADPAQPDGVARSGSNYYYIGSDSPNVRSNPEQTASVEDPVLNN